MPENELPHHSRLTYPGEGGEAEEEAAIRASQQELEASELRRAIERSQLEAAGASGTSSAGASKSSAEDKVLSTDKFTEADVSEMVKQGFSRDKVIAELRSANGNKTQALAALLAKSLKF